MWVWWKLDKGDSKIEFVVVHNVTEVVENYVGLDDWPNFLYSLAYLL